MDKEKIQATQIHFSTISFTVTEYMYVIQSLHVKVTNKQQVGGKSLTDEGKS